MKKVLSILLAAATALTVCGGLAACGGDGGDDANTITVWAPENSLGSETTGGYKSMVAGFKEAYPDYAKYNIKFVAKSEGDAKGAIGNNAKGAADVFFFASDHYKDLVAANVLQPLSDDIANQVKARDAQGTYEFVTGADNKIYAFPTTNDNGFFLWYNDTILSATDVESLDTMLAKCKEKNVHMHFNYSDAWYSASFFFGMGCEFNYDEEGHYVGEANTAAGKAAAKAMFKYADSADNKNAVNPDGGAKKTDVIMAASSFSAGLADGSYGAAISYVSSYKDIEAAVRAKNTDKTTGVVDEASVTAFMSHIKATVLPTFKATIEGGSEQTYHMGTFYGGKYCGVNRTKSEDKIRVSLALANWFTNQQGQTVRFAADGSGPSNTTVAATQAVQESIGLKAYNAQVALGDDTNCVQGAQSDGFWGDSGIKAFAAGVFEHKEGYTTESGVLAKLETLAGAIAD